ncbi:zinc transporter ZIP6 isoform X2 [Thalassophryne amazonica]|uniref:zinc transporter ZIP6 isoform X1 n=1 Tax=Thalassophryne amazonica TaxID=390379 RepID=UPI0014723091|nr:zinc transporter ZIP6 isoform X1 [Thalassophryne amazonica]XP_034039359.1 zinc transporter ZIP6 isoform X2 [Thalassophryne amazonica]
MMDSRKWRAALGVWLLSALCLSGCDSAGGSECSEPDGTTRFMSADVDTQRAEQSRRRHLEAIFNRYGENGTISFMGLKRLLQSVGLDRIRTVMTQHHEHHSHHPKHRHGHDDDTAHQRAHSEVRKLRNTSSGSSEKTTENHDSRHRMHKRAVTLDQERETSNTPLEGKPGEVHKEDEGRSFNSTGATTPRLFIESPTQPPTVGLEDHDPDDGNELINHNLLHNKSLDSIECMNASSILFSHGMSQDVGVTVGDFSYLCPALLNQIDGKVCIHHRHAPEDREKDHKHHNHGHSHHGNHNSTDHGHRDGVESGKNITTAWVGGFVSITVISLLSLLGVVLIPLMNRVFFKFLLSFLVALAVGTLSGDAFLHLIPHSQGGHHHHHEDFGINMEGHHSRDEPQENLDAVWKGLTALGGVYFMFLIEHFLTLGKMYKEKKQKIQKKWDQNDKGELEKQPAVEENNQKLPEDVETNGAGAFGDHLEDLHSNSEDEEEQVMLTPQVAIVTPQDYDQTSGAVAAYTAEDCENKCHSHFHDTVGQADHMHHHHHDYHHILHHHHSQNHHPHSHSHSYSEQHFQKAGVATLAWMVIMGDGLHNFSDGLAIGAAFTESLSSGLSTSVAVFCHELPHELGDFAVLLKAGMTVRQAILYNVLSAMMAYLGMVTGILIGHYAENISMWIFALTAGLFMYVALVDMVPEMLHNDASDHGFSHCGFFLLQNAGILLGFCIMLLIAIFEHKIQLDLGY